jgi:integrase
VAASYTRTKIPGIYERSGSLYVSVTVRGETRRIRATGEHGKNLDAARKFKRDLESARDRGEPIHAHAETERVLDYAARWLPSYQGRGKHRPSERTLKEYARDIDRHWDWFGDTQMGGVSPRVLREFVVELQGKDLASATIRRICAPLRAMFNDAHEMSDIRHNPVVAFRIASDHDDDDEEKAKALATEELGRLIEAMDPKWRLLIEVLACTGLRISEALALTWADIDLGNEPKLHVRRALKQNQSQKVGRPKSKAGRRTIPLPTEIAIALRLRRAEAEWHRDSDPVFPNARGGWMSDGNLRRRFLSPAARAAAVPWAGFHSLRHTYASRLIANGRTIVQVQKLLGHASAAFTLAVYVHLMDGDTGGPLGLDDVRSVQRMVSAPDAQPATPVVQDGAVAEAA